MSSLRAWSVFAFIYLTSDALEMPINGGIELKDDAMQWSKELSATLEKTLKKDNVQE